MLWDYKLDFWLNNFLTHNVGYGPDNMLLDGPFCKRTLNQAPLIGGVYITCFKLSIPITPPLTP